RHRRQPRRNLHEPIRHERKMPQRGTKCTRLRVNSHLCCIVYSVFVRQLWLLKQRNWFPRFERYRTKRSFACSTRSSPISINQMTKSIVFGPLKHATGGVAIKQVSFQLFLTKN